MPNRTFTKTLPQQNLSERGQNSPAVVNTTQERILRKIHEAVARKQQKKTIDQVVDLHPTLKRDTTSDRTVSQAREVQHYNPAAPAVTESSILDRATVDKVLAREIKLTEHASHSLQKKSRGSGIPLPILETVYRRGVFDWEEGTRDQNQFAFDRVNSFIAGGRARKLDRDLLEHGDSSINQRFMGTPELTQVYAKDTPGQERISIIRNQLRSINNKNRGPK